MPLELPHPASTPITERTAGDSMWAAMYESLPLPPMIILGMPILQHPQPQSAQMSSGTILPFHIVPTSQHPAMALLSTEPLHQHLPTSNIEGLPQSGTNLSRPSSAHPSLYEPLRNPSPAPQHSQSLRATTGLMSWSSVHHSDPDVTEEFGNESTDSSGQSHNLHWSYSCPLSHNMSTSPMRQAVREPFMSFPKAPCLSLT